jgi:HSP20 family molecular chaperone IbpA/RNA polymerase subunit RPABC4/transcription elongation factor Spt4
MFNKKNCKGCKKKIKGSYNFCPFCGTRNMNLEDYGMLGIEDNHNAHQPINAPMKRSFLDSMIDRVVESAMNAMEKEVQKEMNSQKGIPKQNFQIMINGKKVDPELLGFSAPEERREIRKVSKPFGEEKRRKMKELPEKEPKTSVRRLSNKVLYEIEVPGVESIDDISINQLENSIEVKAISLKNAYKKLIPVSLPIRRYSVSKGKITLELASE